MVLELVRNMSIIKTLGIGLELFLISRLLLQLVLTEIANQVKSGYWSQTNFNFKTSLGIGIEINIKSSLGLEQDQWSRITLPFCTSRKTQSDLNIFSQR